MAGRARRVLRFVVREHRTTRLHDDQGEDLARRLDEIEASLLLVRSGMVQVPGQRRFPSLKAPSRPASPLPRELRIRLAPLATASIEAVMMLA